MRRLGHAGKVDANHGEILGELRKRGVLVRSTAALGSDFPDIIAAFRDVLVLLEVKRPGEKPTKGQAEFIATWPRTYVVTSPDEAYAVVVEAANPGAAKPEEGAK